MPTGPKGEKRPADTIGLAVTVAKIATGEIDDTPAEDGNVFMRAMQRKGLGSELGKDLLEKIENPINFKPMTKDLGHGYEAHVLVDICKAVIRSKQYASQNFKLRHYREICAASRITTDVILRGHGTRCEPVPCDLQPRLCGWRGREPVQPWLASPQRILEGSFSGCAVARPLPPQLHVAPLRKVP